jgi:hypothetical protein
MFLGREQELESLNALLRKTTSSLVVCRGRRRIGKSTLIKHFAQKTARFIEFQGLPPVENPRTEDQLKAFTQQLTRQTGIPKLSLSAWDQAFALLASQIRNEKTVVLLDEISWMAAGDRNFAGYLKIAWDTQFKAHDHLVLVVCGSVSAWIQENILNNTGFVGRISLTLTLDPLPLYHCNRFWSEKTDRISSLEKLKILAVTGGVPRYLEEIDTSRSAEQNIHRLMFRKDGFLFSEFGKIFHDIFSPRAPIYRSIVQALGQGPLSLHQVAAKIGKERNGYLAQCLEHLELSGFVKKYPVYAPGAKRASRLHQFRISDNYLRFYLKYVEPVQSQIEQDLYRTAPLQGIIAWDPILGIQFETLVLSNLHALLKLLDIAKDPLSWAGPYFQNETNRHEACQIDLLLQTTHTLYVCEIKRRSAIGPEVIEEVREKIRRLTAPANLTVRMVLIYQGTLSDELIRRRCFDHTISFEEMLKSRV